jgi:hypothetical protein
VDLALNLEENPLNSGLYPIKVDPERPRPLLQLQGNPQQLVILDRYYNLDTLLIDLNLPSESCKPRLVPIRLLGISLHLQNHPSLRLEVEQGRSHLLPLAQKQLPQLPLHPPLSLNHLHPALDLSSLARGGHLISSPRRRQTMVARPDQWYRNLA